MLLFLEISEGISFRLPCDQSGGSISERGTKDIGLEDDLVADLEVEDVIGLVVCSGRDGQYPMRPFQMEITILFQTEDRDHSLILILLPETRKTFPHQIKRKAPF
jgi:hypothetical protein